MFFVGFMYTVLFSSMRCFFFMRSEEIYKDLIYNAFQTALTAAKSYVTFIISLVLLLPSFFLSF